MKFNKLILGMALAVPMFAASCNNTKKITDLPTEPTETLYAFSENNELNIEVLPSDVEFVEPANFKKEYFKFDTSLVSGKTYSVERVSSKKIKVKFNGTYTGTAFEEDPSAAVRVGYKISTDAFKKEKVVVVNDAYGEMIMKCDKAESHGGINGTATSIDVAIKFDSLNTDIRIKSDFESTASPIPISKFSDSFTSGSVSVSYDSSAYELQLNISDLDNAEEGAEGSILLRNVDDFDCFENMPNGYGFRFDLEAVDPEAIGTYKYQMRQDVLDPIYVEATNE